MTGHSNKRAYNDDEAAQNYSSTRSLGQKSERLLFIVFNLSYQD